MTISSLCTISGVQNILGAECVPIVTWNGEKGLTLVKKNELFRLQHGAIN